MKWNHFFPIGIGALCLLSVQESIAVSNTTDFFSKFAHHLLKNTHQNLAFSPYAVRQALGMAGFGARGRTQRQLGRPLDFGFAKKDSASKLYVANRLWIQYGNQLTDNFLDASDRNFNERPWMVDFTKEPDFLADRVNGWVEENTNGKVRHFISIDDVNPTDQMMLSSAVFFKGDWMFPFDSALTKEERFVTHGQEILKTAFIHGSGEFRYRRVSDFQILDLPFRDGEVSMLFLLPDMDSSLAALEESLDFESLERWTADMKLAEVSIALPKFQMESALELTKTLKSMDIIDPFQETADFSGMTGKRGLVLGSVRHKTWVSLSEEGTVARSGTGASSVNRKLASVTAPVSFRAHRPFLFMIWHRGTNMPIFMGRVENPVRNATGS